MFICICCMAPSSRCNTVHGCWRLDWVRTHRHTQTDKSETVYLPVSLRSLGGYNNRFSNETRARGAKQHVSTNSFDDESRALGAIARRRRLMTWRSVCKNPETWKWDRSIVFFLKQRILYLQLFSLSHNAHSNLAKCPIPTPRGRECTRPLRAPDAIKH